MNREARRAAGKNEVKKVSNKALQKWIRSLNKNQVTMITQYAQMQYDKRFNQLTNCLDAVFTAAVIEKLDIPISEIDEIFKNVFDLMEEDNFREKNLRRNKSEKELEDVANKIMDIIEPKEISKNEKEPKIKLEPIKNSKVSNVSNVSVIAKDVLEVEKIAEATKQAGKALTELKMSVDLKAPKEENAIKKGPLDGIKVRKIEAVGRFANYTAESKRVKFKLDRSFDVKSWNAFKNEVEQVFAMMEDK